MYEQEFRECISPMDHSQSRQALSVTPGGYPLYAATLGQRMFYNPNNAKLHTLPQTLDVDFFGK